MNKAKALLDSLMGPSRDQALKERSGDEFKSEKVCKNYLVGYCPDHILGKKLAACRTEFDRPSIVNPGCTKMHSVALKTEYQSHKDFAKYQAEYERDLIKYLENIVREADGKAVYEKRKRDDMQITWEFHERLCDICGMKYKLEKKDGMLGSGLGQDCYKDDNHTESDLHKQIVKLRAKLQELKEKDKLRRDQDGSRGDEAKDGNKKASRSRDRSRGKESGKRARSRDATRDKSRERRPRSNDRKRSRSDDRKKRSASDDKRKRAGSEDKNKKRSKSDDKGKRRSPSRSRRDRSAKRKASRSRSKRAASQKKKGSRSRSKSSRAQKNKKSSDANKKKRRKDSSSSSSEKAKSSSASEEDSSSSSDAKKKKAKKAKEKSKKR